MTPELTQFSELNLGGAIQKALDKLTFTTPTPVQAETIPLLMAGHDLIAKAQTGTGKTAAFALPILAKLDVTLEKPQALILAPTRELAIQVAEQVSSLSQFMKGLDVAILCGGQDYRRQLQQLKKGAQVIVGTPGRILDHIDRKSINFSALKTFILDEADEMLRMGFIEDVESIMSKLPNEKQMALFSATMPGRIRDIANRYLKDAKSVEIHSKTATVQSIEQQFLFASQGEKPAALLRILAHQNFQSAIVFVRTKIAADEMAALLQSYQHKAMAIHGDLNQSLRERIIEQFRQGQIEILVATDVAARGLDIEHVTHVINYDIPFDCETYVHRIGRTGRAGRSGVAVLFITPKETRLLNQIERHTKQTIAKILVPSDEEIQIVRKTRFMKAIVEKMEHSGMDSYRELFNNLMTEQNCEAMDIAAALALMLNNNQPWNKPIALPHFGKGNTKSSSQFERRERNDRFDRNDRNDRGFRGDRNDRFERNDRNDRGFRGERNDKQGASRDKFKDAPQDAMLYRIEVGRLHGVKPGNIVGAIANEAGLNSKHITGIKIHDEYSTVYLPKGMPKDAMRALQRAWVCGQQLNLKAQGGSAY